MVSTPRRPAGGPIGPSGASGRTRDERQIGQRMKRIGVDVGGTFTDLVLWDDDGTVTVHKTPSTNHDPSIGTMDGIAVLAEQAGVDPSEIEMFFHGTTVATNIVLEHNGSDVGMITTEGFRDLLHIARKKRPLELLQLPGPALAEVAAGAPAQPPGRPRAHRRGRQRARRPRRRRRTPRGPPAARARRPGDRRRVPPRLPQPGPRAAGQGHHRGGVPRRLHLAVQRGRAAVPRVRALLDHRAQRLHRAQDLDLHRQPRRQGQGGAGRRRRPPDDVRRRPRHLPQRRRRARLAAHQRRGRRPARWLRHREGLGLPERHHPRRRRHLRRRGRGLRRQGCA